MSGSLRSVKSVLLSVAVLLIGHGLQLTLLPLQAHNLGWANSLIGFTGSAYYLGFVAGCLIVPRVIRRAGHIRAFSMGVAIAAMSVLLAAIWQEFAAWLLLRFLTGLSLAGLYTVVESWLNERSTNDNRGSIMAIYTTVSLGAIASGQLFVELDNFTLAELFPVAAVLIMGATLPIGFTTQAQPAAPTEIHFNWSLVYKASHVGVICASLSGVVVGLLWSMGAVYASDLIGSVEVGSRFILAAILGGCLTQIPAGKLSDLVDRRWIILGLAIVGLCGAGLLLSQLFDGAAVLYLAAFMCGAGAMPMYSISVAHANDNADGRFLQIASGMLMSNALGSVIGPLIYSGLATLGWSQAFMGVIACAFAACVVTSLLRLKTHEVSREHYEPFHPLPETTVEAVGLDPRLPE